jgi:predicted XRE-type DNA-binding protein
MVKSEPGPELKALMAELVRAYGSQAELAEHTGVSQPWISHIAKWGHRPDRDHLLGFLKRAKVPEAEVGQWLEAAGYTPARGRGPSVADDLRRLQKEMGKLADRIEELERGTGK